MSKPMPVGNFQWLEEHELAEFDPLSLNPEQDAIGYICEVTLSYPTDFHIDHNSLPLAAEKLNITNDMLSPYAANALSYHKKKGGSGAKYKATKLSTTFCRREKYVCHAACLKLYLELGMKLIKVHRVIRFDQKSFIRPYIDFCAKKRAESKTKSRGNVYKLSANSVFGKMIENADNRMDTVFVRDRATALKRNSDPRNKGQMILAENLSISFQGKKRVKLAQLWPVGFSILEFSKAHMLALYYKQIKPAFGSRVSCLLSDTDSFVLALSAPSADDAMRVMKGLGIADTSNYSKDSDLYDPSTKSVPGLLKNECPDDAIVEVVAVRSKTYALRSSKSFDSRCKGVKTNVRKKIPFYEFRDVVTSSTPKAVDVLQHTIQSKNHVNRLISTRKTAFTNFDDKKYLAPCGIHTYPYGSKLIQWTEERNACFFCSNPRLFA